MKSEKELEMTEKAIRAATNQVAENVLPTYFRACDVLRWALDLPPTPNSTPVYGMLEECLQNAKEQMQNESDRLGKLIPFGTSSKLL